MSAMRGQPGPTPSDGIAQPQSKYRPILEIGQGGMSRVYLALVRGPGDFNKLQVIKRLLPTLAADPEFLEMFLEEARLSARLNHANIVQINEIGFDGVNHFMAMEYLEGQTLDAVVRASAKRGGLPLAMHLRIIADACAGLHYAHDLTDIDGKPLNIVHRDVSPHNVFVTYAGQIKVLDFGIAKAADSSHHTRTGVVKGKCAYMAPEQFRQEGIDRRADIFALGVMTWQAATRTRLWKGLTDIEIFHRLATGEIPSPLSIDPSMPTGLVAICERALAPNRDQRYSTAQELGEAIEAYLGTLPDVPSSREIGKYVSDLFAENRAKVKAAIEAERKRNESYPTNTGEIPIFVDPDAVRDDSNSQPVVGNAAAGPEIQLLDAQAAAPGAAPPAGAGGLTKTKAVVLVGLAALVVGGAVLGSLWWRKGHQEIAEGPGSTTNTPITGASTPGQRPQVGGATGTTSADPSAALSDAYTLLKVEVVPHNANVFVDDVPLSSNPATARFSRDKLPHRVLGEAPGYARQVELVVYDEAEKQVVIQLEREGANPAAHPVAQPPRGGPAIRHTSSNATSNPPTALSQSPPTSPPTSTYTAPPVTASNPPPPPNTGNPPPPTANPTVAAPAPGTVDARGVKATIRAHSGEVQACYDRAHLERNDLHGKVVVSATIAPQGQVANASIANSTTNSTRLEQCLMSAFQSWTFPQPAGGVNGNVTYTFNFD